MEWKDPVTGSTYGLTLARIGDLSMSPYQRKLSTNLTNKLTTSVAHGFVVPLVAVRTDDGLTIIDGQHRLEALRALCHSDDTLVPVLVVPPKFLHRPLLLNIEKSDDIKDKCQKVYSLYFDPQFDTMLETDFLAFIFNERHLLTISIAYIELSLPSPSLVESVVKFLDSAIKDTPVSATRQIRRDRATYVKQLSDTVDSICETYGIRDFNIKRSIVSTTKTALWGRSRKAPSDDFVSNMSDLIDAIQSRDWSGLAGYDGGSYDE